MNLNKRKPLTKLLFVCLGNICRSPAAEGIMQSLISNAELDNSVLCDSCGTSANHLGEAADPRMIEHASKRGYKLLSISRPLNAPKDFEEFDFIFVMDQFNYDTVIAHAKKPEHKQKVFKITSFCSKFKTEDVPDPYYGGAKGFEHVLDLLEDSCKGVLNQIIRK